ncbi:FAD-dependent oxidoreductase [Arthrobacter sp. H14]|uniref:FAD-dependent oxidoreductase n=1 Tax=Arthrobacter sp. H14 TaxID=1312959 RepID=UPI00047970C8
MQGATVRSGRPGHDRCDRALPALDPDMGGLVATAMEGFRMDVRLGEAVTGFDTHDGKVTAVAADRATIPADLVILGLGVAPNTALAARAGIPLGRPRRSLCVAAGPPTNLSFHCVPRPAPRDRNRSRERR